MCSKVVCGEINGIVFNLYDSSKKQYLGTFSNLNDNYEVKEFIQEEKIGDETIFFDPYGNRLIYTGNNEFIFIDTKNTSFNNNGKVIYNPSLLELKQKHLKLKTETYESLKQKGAPSFILNKSIKSINKCKDEISKILYEDKSVSEGTEYEEH